MARTSIVSLEDRHARWFSPGRRIGAEPQLWIRGYARFGETQLTDQALADTVAESLRRQGVAWDVALAAFVPSLNGAWALVARWSDGRVFAAVDRVRSIPLFHIETPEAFLVCDSPESAQCRGHARTIDLLSAYEYLLCGYVTGQSTVLEGLRQLPSGTMLQADPAGGPGKTVITQYYYCLPQREIQGSPDDMKAQMMGIFERMYGAFIRSNPGKILVPLSGGLDSRLNVAMLKRLGAEDVECFTYGRPDDIQCRTSRQVAEALQYPWHMVEYTPRTWAGVMGGRTGMEYLSYAAKASSQPQLQDFPALMELMDRNWRRPVVFFPGHNAILPTKYEELTRQAKSVAQTIFDRHYYYFAAEGSPLTQRLKEKIAQLSSSPAGNSGDDPIARCEMWDVAFRQSQVIVNSVRAYEFLDARWQVCWDYELMDFYVSLPRQMRLGKSLFTQTLRDMVFTGPAAALRDIPAAKNSPGSSLFCCSAEQRMASRRPRQHKLLKAVLDALGLLDAARNACEKRTLDGRLLQTTFTLGKSPWRLNLKQVLAPFHTYDNLPTALQPCLRQQFGLRVDTLDPCLLTAAVTLGQICSGVQPAVTATYPRVRQDMSKPVHGDAALE
ncbi:MAG: hypothetical protein LLG01_12615 [Planctomycetaceae bacterium]|nr:hypothetical protein [Planctomycetaceae bacterium]